MSIGVPLLLAGQLTVMGAAQTRGCHTPWTDERGAAAAVSTASQAEGVRTLDVRAPTGGSRLRLSWPLAPGEHLFGSGERFGPFDLVGHAVEGWTSASPGHTEPATSYTVTPFLLSSRGHGLLVETSARTHIDAGLAHPGCLTIEVDAPSARVDTLPGPTPAAVLAQHAGLVGHPPLPPPWALGVWKTTIGGPAAIRGELDHLAAAGVPLDAVWIYDGLDAASGFGWPWQIYGPTRPGRYPDLAGLIAELHHRGLKVLGYLNPFVYTDSPTWAQAAAAGYLVTDRAGQPLISSVLPTPSAFVDLTNPAAYAWFQARVQHAIADVGFDGAMQDFGDDAPTQGVYASGEPGAVVHNRYPLLYAQAVREAAQRARPEGTAFITRAGYTGSQQYTTGAWPGDQARSWDPARGLPSVVSAMLSGSISGWPYWGPDIGGFFSPRTVPAERELWIRWVQLGALSPLMRDMLGAQSTPVGLWTDPQTSSIFGEYARLHHVLAPYLAGLAEQAHATGLPLLRPLFLDDPADPTSYRVGDEYTLGDRVLVAPITRPGQRQRSVYLPAGDWCDVATGARYRGHTWAQIPAPLERIPLLVRADASAGPPAALPCPARPHRAASH